jgi:hypothetical protein
MKLKSFLFAISFLVLAGCAEPDSVEEGQNAGATPGVQKPGATPEAGSALATLQQKYDSLKLNCNLTLKDKTIFTGNESTETKTASAVFNLLDSNNISQVAHLSLNSTNVKTDWQIGLTSLQVRYVSFSDDGQAFEADRSPVVGALVDGSLSKAQPAVSNNERVNELETKNLSVEFLENTTTVLIDHTVGPTQNPDLSILLSCHMEAIPKAQFANEFRRK